MDRQDITEEPLIPVPNFNDAALSLVIFHTQQSIPLLRYDFKKAAGNYNFNEDLLAGMISAIMTVSDEIDREKNRSTLRKIDQTTYIIIVAMGKKAGVLLVALKDENEQILREFCNYILAEFERRYLDLLSSDASFEEDMFKDFIQVIKKTAMVPVTFSPELILDLLPIIKAQTNVNVMICDKLIFTPIFKSFKDYISPNELQHLRTLLKETVMSSSKFLDQMQRYGALETIVVHTNKRKIFVRSLEPFYFIVIAGRDVTEIELQPLFESVTDAVFKDSLALNTRQRAFFFQNLESIVTSIPDLDPKLFQDELVRGLKKFQKEHRVLLRNVDQYPVQEKRTIYAELLDELFQGFTQNLGEKVDQLKAEIQASFETFLLS
jgi:predicted regulator of Ras-like GTPase activity (Roadblock/LC7/MglB family)